jgi:hypothetical protein
MLEGVFVSDAGETTELVSLAFTLPGFKISGWGDPEDTEIGETISLALRRPTGAGLGCCVEIDKAGGPLGFRTVGIPVICENRVAGP